MCFYEAFGINRLNRTGTDMFTIVNIGCKSIDNQHQRFHASLNSSKYHAITISSIKMPITILVMDRLMSNYS